jgi:hypothetical protein
MFKTCFYPGKQASLRTRQNSLTLYPISVLLNTGTQLPCLRVIIQRHADGAAMVAIVLADDVLALQLPETRIMVRASRNEIRRVGREGAVPNPSLMAIEFLFELEALLLLLVFFVALQHHGGRILEIHCPDSGGVVCRASGEMSNVWREQDSRDVRPMGLELGHGN